MNLDAWQSRLEKHFEALAEIKRASSYPLFALEHGLEGDEIKFLGGALERHLAYRPMDRRHWLCWIVFATEVGYEYEGDEYWPLLEERLPSWRGNGSRSSIQSYFRKFEKIHGAVSPSGPWAEYFRNISWPITHAILPRYLQLQFANALFVLRYRLASLRSLEPEAVGEVVAAHAAGVSSRFEEFLQQRLVAGSIILGLLSANSECAPVTEAALRRIVSDLEEEKSGKGLLSDARKAVANRFQIVGARRKEGTRQEEERRADDAQSELKPRIMLRPSFDQSWSAIIEMPAFTAFVRSSAELREVIDKSRCQVAGVAEEWLPAGWLARDGQKRKLATWPADQAALLGFEKSHPALTAEFSRGAWRVGEPPWLFKISPDGYAYQVLNRTVQAGRSYVVISRTAISGPGTLLTPCTIECAGVSAVRLDVPDKLSAAQQAFLEGIGLRPTSLLEICPIGLPSIARPYDDSCEWLTTDEPAFVLKADRELARINIRLGDQNLSLLNPGNRPLFQLGRLAAGEHELSITAHTSAHAGIGPAELRGRLHLIVREPQPWLSGRSSHAGLTVLVDPPVPSFDQFAAGEVELTVLGPENRKVSARLALFDARGRRIGEEVSQGCTLPLQADRWRNVNDQLLRKEPERIEEASSAKLSIAADELGVFVLRLERTMEPLRWVYRGKGDATELRLVDDTGNESPDAIQMFSLAQPRKHAPLSTGDAMSGFQPEQGGLVIARSGNHTAALAFTLNRKAVELSSLAARPPPTPIPQRAEELIALQECRTFWRSARSAGPLANQQRQWVVDSFDHAILSAVCGSSWAAREKTLAHALPTPAQLRNFQSLVGQAGLAAALYRNYRDHKWNRDEIRVWFYESVKRYGVCNYRQVTDLALRWARYRPDLSRSDFSYAHEHATVFRAARFLYWLNQAQEGTSSRREVS